MLVKSGAWIIIHHTSAVSVFIGFDVCCRKNLLYFCRYWAREVVWCCNRLRQEKNDIIWRNIRDITNLRKENFWESFPYLMRKQWIGLRALYRLTVFSEESKSNGLCYDGYRKNYHIHICRSMI